MEWMGTCTSDERWRDLASGNTNRVPLDTRYLQHECTLLIVLCPELSRRLNNHEPLVRGQERIEASKIKNQISQSSFASVNAYTMHRRRLTGLLASITQGSCWLPDVASAAS